MKKAYHFTVQVEVILETWEDDAVLPEKLSLDVMRAFVDDFNHVQDYGDNTSIEHASVGDGVGIEKFCVNLEKSDE